MLPRFAGFFLSMLVIVGGASYYVHKKSSRAFGLGPRARRALALSLAASLVFGLGSRLLERALPAALLAPLGALGSAVSVAVLMAAVLLAVLDLVILAARLPARIVKRPPAPAPANTISADTAPPDPDRRRFVTQAATGSVLALAGGSSFYGTFFGRHDYVIEEVPTSIPGLSPRLDGYTIVQLSDIHLGLFVGDPEMRAAEALVEKARPDLLVLTGDLSDHDPRYTEALGRLVRRLSGKARDGILAIPGNHDYFTGWDAVAATLAKGGATVLRNDGRLIGDPKAGFALLGVDDAWGARVDPRAPGPDLKAALAAVPASADLPRILLCHNPSFFPRAAGKVALQLSGHTHGGQVNLGIRPADYVLGYPYVAGRYELFGSRIWVNRGFGTAGPPARVGAAPEVTRVILTV
jgi:hypothetical protein